MALANGLAAADFDNNLEKTFEVGPKLFLRTSSGDIQLEASNVTPKVEAEAEAK